MTYRCGVPDSMRLVLPAGQRPWPKDNLSFRIDAYVEGIARDRQDYWHQTAFNGWSEVSPLRFRQVGARQPADIIYSTGRGPRANFDGPSGVLAWMQLANGSGQPVHGSLDLDERWTEDPDTDIYIPAVLAHEDGHALGLDHDTDRSVALMDPTYNRRIFKPQPNDIRRIQALYGPPPTPLPPEPPPVPAGAAGWVTRLYQDVLGRQPSDAEVSQWVVKAGDRLAVAKGILASAEHHGRVVDGWYTRFLKRNADSTGRANFVAALNSGMSYETAVAVVLTSEEYFGRQTGASVGLDPARPVNPVPPDGGGGRFVDEIIETVANQLIDTFQQTAKDFAAGTAWPFDDWLVAGVNRFVDANQARFVAAFKAQLSKLLGGFLSGQITAEQLKTELATIKTA